MKTLLAVSAILACLLLRAGDVRAAAEDIRYDGPDTWEHFQKFMDEREEKDRVTGLSYMISGALATVGGVAGYYGTTDTFSRGAFAVSQTLGVAALGYGASVYWNGNTYNSFYRAVRDSALSPQQKSDLLVRYMRNERIERDRNRWIRIGVHTLLAGMNFYSANREENRDVRNLLQFLGAVNVVIALSF